MRLSNKALAKLLRDVRNQPVHIDQPDIEKILRSENWTDAAAALLSRAEELAVELASARKVVAAAKSGSQWALSEALDAYTRQTRGE